MGQYLIIGLKTVVGFEKRFIGKQPDAVEKAIAKLREELAPADVYDMEEDETHVLFKLKPALLEQELADFLYDFYSDRFLRSSDCGQRDSIIAHLKTYKSYEEIQHFIDTSRYENLRKDYYWAYNYISLNGWDTLRVFCRGIDLSLDGKILIECYDSLFDYFERLIKASLSKYKLASALRVTISG